MGRVHRETPGEDGKIIKDVYQYPWPGGVTAASKKEFLRLRHAVGKIECVVVTNLVTNPSDTETIVVGDKARLHLDGFSIGYSGEGPYGLIWLLEYLDIPYNEEDILFSKPETDTVIFSVPKEE